jgi:hypothetical protein
VRRAATHAADGRHPHLRRGVQPDVSGQRRRRSHHAHRDPDISPDVGNSIECRANGLFANQIPNTTGVNFVGCGIQITNGLWTALATPFQPVLDITSSDGSVTINRVDCVIDISGAVGDGTIGGLTIINYDTVADLPVSNSVNPVATVGLVNPRRLFIFVTGFGWREVLDSTATSLQINL